MPIERTVTYTLYTIDELSDKAKDRARGWMRRFVGDRALSDEAIDEDIAANEYTFDEDGRRKD